MQGIIKYISLSFLIISCASQDDALGPQSESELPVRFVTSTNEMSAVTESRTVIDGNLLPQGDQVGIFGIPFEDEFDDYTNYYYDEYDSYEKYIESKYTMRNLLSADKFQRNLCNNPYTVCEETTNGNRLEAQWEAKFTPGEHKGIVFVAYYPYIPLVPVVQDTEGKKLGYGFRTYINMKSMESTPDYLMAKKVQQNTEDPVVLNFQHLMARLNIYFYTDKPYETLFGIRRHSRLRTIYMKMKSSPVGQVKLYNDDQFFDNINENTFKAECYNPSLAEDTIGYQNYTFGRDSIVYISKPNSTNIGGRNLIKNQIRDAGYEHSFLLYEGSQISDIKFVIENMFSHKLDTLSINSAKITDLVSKLAVRRSVNLYVQYSPSVPIMGVAAATSWDDATSPMSRNSSSYFITTESGELIETDMPPVSSDD